VGSAEKVLKKKWRLLKNFNVDLAQEQQLGFLFGFTTRRDEK